MASKYKKGKRQKTETNMKYQKKKQKKEHERFKKIEVEEYYKEV